LKKMIINSPIYYINSKNCANFKKPYTRGIESERDTCVVEMHNYCALEEVGLTPTSSSQVKQLVVIYTV
jgi:hypothetical protein